MHQTTSETERKVIDILVGHERTPNAYGTPIQAVGKMLGWDTDKAKHFVAGLQVRKVIAVIGEGRQGSTENLKSMYWKET
jgi:hypothetical protein